MAALWERKDGRGRSPAPPLHAVQGHMFQMWPHPYRPPWRGAEATGESRSRFPFGGRSSSADLSPEAIWSNIRRTSSGAGGSIMDKSLLVLLLATTLLAQGAAQVDDAPESLHRSVGLAMTDPCQHVHCPAGKECVVNEELKKPECQCISDCGFEPDPRRKVCTNHNETFSTDCEVHQLRCFCEAGLEDKCRDPEKYRHVHVEYFGECRKIPQCSHEEMADFPRRMREWLFNVMKELGERSELSHHYQELKKDAEMNLGHRWSNAAVWKWCDLDKHPHDNVVSRHELFPIRAPLQTLEHCIGDFLDWCDADSDHQITLKEWATCLELEEVELLGKCEAIN